VHRAARASKAIPIRHVRNRPLSVTGKTHSRHGFLTCQRPMTWQAPRMLQSAAHSAGTQACAARLFLQDVA
jgi:hypothetical protein